MRSKSENPIILRVAGINEGHLTYLMCSYYMCSDIFFHFMRSKKRKPIILSV